MAEKISGIYKITNTVTNDFYIGSSKNIKKRWANHKCLSKWNEHPNNPMYQNMKKYGLDYFVFEILAEVDIESLKEAEQHFIEKLKPTYNDRNANGWNIESHKKSQNKYKNQSCCYNGETLTLNALACRFIRAGIENPTIEAKKYLISNLQS